MHDNDQNIRPFTSNIVSNLSYSHTTPGTSPSYQHRTQASRAPIHPPTHPSTGNNNQTPIIAIPTHHSKTQSINISTPPRSKTKFPLNPRKSAPTHTLPPRHHCHPHPKSPSPLSTTTTPVPHIAKPTHRSRNGESAAVLLLCLLARACCCHLHLHLVSPQA